MSPLLRYVTDNIENDETKNAVETGSDVTIYVPNFIKILVAI
jgi:hypothetical protein